MNFLYKFLGWLLIIVSVFLLITVLSLYAVEGFSLFSILSALGSGLGIWLGFWMKKTDPKLLQERMEKRAEEFGKRLDEIAKSSKDKAQEQVNALSLNELEEQIAIAKKFRFPTELFEKRKIALQEEDAEARKVAQQAERAQKLAEKEREKREEKEENERRLKFLEDNKKLIEDSSLEEKIAKSYMNYKHTMGMPKKYVDDIYGKINDRKETVSKKGKTVKGKYIWTGTNQLGNDTYKYEMTFENSILTGWKEL